MKSILFLTSSLLLAGAVNAGALLEPREGEEYVQNPSGTASFTHYSGCDAPACGKTATGFTSGMSQLAYGAPPGLGAGDACGRCFVISGSADPYSPDSQGPFKSIVVKINNLCPVEGNEKWCGQTVSNPINSFGQSVHFDLCEDTGAPEAFFPEGVGALTGTYQEVECTEWVGSDGPDNWEGACLAPEDAAFWPSTACKNKGTPPL